MQENSGKYSPLRHIAQSIWSFSFTGNELFVMLSEYTAYFDASGKKDVPYTVVAGYISTVNAWLAFEADWRFVLHKYCVPYLHMLELSHGIGAYDEPRWRSQAYSGQFLAEMVSVIESCAIAGIGCGVSHSLFDQMNKRFALKTRVNPYALCGRDCAVRAKKHIRSNYSDNAAIEYIFEEGDKGHGLLEIEMKRSAMPMPVFRIGKPDKRCPDVIPTIQLQACDILAWQLRRTKEKREERYRNLLLSLRRTEPLWFGYEEVDLLNFCASAKIKPRT